MDRCAVVFTGGKSPMHRIDNTLIPPDPYVCAADSGLDTALRLGFSVNYAVGDFDSLSSELKLLDIPHQRMPRDKDETDTELALRHIQDCGFTQYVLIGGGEGRLDHLLHLFAVFAQFGPPCRWLTASETLYCIHDDLHMPLPEGTLCSVLPAIADGSSRVTSNGFQWELDHYLIDACSQSISNRTRSHSVGLSVSGDPVFLAVPNKNL